MRPAMWVVGLGNMVNVVGNTLLIEPLGVAGLAWSTTIVRWVMLAALIALGWPVLRRARPEGRILDIERLGAVASLALPVGLQVALEVWAFNLATFVAGWLGASAVAAHTASLNAAATAFMVPMGISAAAATRVGNLVGSGADWRRAAGASIALGAGAMTLSGTAFLLLPDAIGRAYNPDPEVVALVAATLPIGALFGCFDGVQVVAFGVLRGLGDTRRPALFNLLGYWVIGLPLGGFLALRLGFGLPGVWLGLTVALGVVAALLLVRIHAHARAHSSPIPSGSLTTGTRRTSR
jgi:MATE family multidrug resistance protein